MTKLVQHPNNKLLGSFPLNPNSRKPSFVIGNWTAGASTTLSIVDGRARATRAGDNPRIYRIVSGLISGSQYRVNTNMYKGTVSGNIFFRASSSAAMLNTYGEIASSVDTPLSLVFTAPAGGEVYLGLVAASNTNGQYAETDEEFILTKE